MVIIATHGVRNRSPTIVNTFGIAFWCATDILILNRSISIIRAVLNVENNAITERIRKLCSPKTRSATNANGACAVDSFLPWNNTNSRDTDEDVNYCGNNHRVHDCFWDVSCQDSLFPLLNGLYLQNQGTQKKSGPLPNNTFQSLCCFEIVSQNPNIRQTNENNNY